MDLEAGRLVGSVLDTLKLRCIQVQVAMPVRDLGFKYPKKGLGLEPQILISLHVGQNVR